MKIKTVELARSCYGVHELLADRDPLPKVAVIGRSNVGKSSFVNSMVNRRKMARTSSKPGKTLSVNYYRINDRFYLVDLPGYGYAKVSRREKGRARSLILRFLEKGENLRLVILLVDCRRELREEEAGFIDIILKRDIKILTVITKSDKLSFNKIQGRISFYKKQYNIDVIPYSIKSNHNRMTLLDLVGEGLKEKK